VPSIDASPILSDRTEESLFLNDRVRVALEKYAAVTRLAVRIYDRDGQVITEPIRSNPLFKLFSLGREPQILGDCVRRCFAQAKALAIVVENGHGLAVVGAPFISGGNVVYAAVAA
jgi:hypothetical protein